METAPGGFSRGHWVCVHPVTVLGGCLGSLRRAMAGMQAGALQSLTSLLAAGLKDKMLFLGNKQG